MSSFPAEVMVFITMSEFRDPREDLFVVDVCLKVGRVDAPEEGLAVLRLVFSFVFLAVAS